MSRVFLFVVALLALTFAGDVTTADPPATTSGSTSEVTVNTIESSPTTMDAAGSTVTESSPTTSEVTNSATSKSSTTKSDVTDSNPTEGSSTKSDIDKSSTTTTTESIPVKSDKPFEDVPSNKIPSFQYFAVPFFPLNGLVLNYSGQYGVLPPSFGSISDSVSQQTERKKVKEPEKEPKVPSVIGSPAPASLPEFLQGIHSMQELTQMVFSELLNQQRGNGTCGGLIKLVSEAEINHHISLGLPPADVESCSWVIWTQGDGPITVDFPKGRNAEFDDSLSCLWVLNINASAQYQKTLLKPGDRKIFPTGTGAKGYYPFVIVHMLVKETEPGQRLHLRFYDQNQGSTYQLRPNVTYLNETLTYGRHAVVTHPPNRMSSYGPLERFFFMGQTPKGKRVSLQIVPKRLPADSYTWIQVSWIDFDSFQIHQEKLSGRSSMSLRKYLKPSTSFVVVFCSLVGGDAGRGFSLYYQYY